MVVYRRWITLTWPLVRWRWQIRALLGVVEMTWRSGGRGCVGCMDLTVVQGGDGVPGAFLMISDSFGP